MSKVVTPKQRFDHLLRVLASTRFLEKQGLGNEVPFFICPFPPEDAFVMERDRQQLIKRLGDVNVRVLEVNLYDLAVGLMKARDIWEQVLEMEPSVSKGEIMDLLQGVLDPEAHLIPGIADAMAGTPHDVLFLSGVGEVYPFIRSHSVLNNLQSTAKEKPTLMFFPGDYTHAQATGASLELFGRLHDDKYYRAFNIMNYEV
jgi:hypothetical protein